MTCWRGRCRREVDDGMLESCVCITCGSGRMRLSNDKSTSRVGMNCVCDAWIHGYHTRASWETWYGVE